MKNADDIDDEESSDLNEEKEANYKMINSHVLKKSVQFGIVHFISEINGHNSIYNNDRILLLQDFEVVESKIFHKYSSFVKKNICNY